MMASSPQRQQLQVRLGDAGNSQSVGRWIFQYARSSRNKRPLRTVYLSLLPLPLCTATSMRLESISPAWNVV